MSLEPILPKTPRATKKQPPPPEAVACSLERLLLFRNGADKLNKGAARQRSASLLAGAHRSPFRGRGMDFEEVRLYQPGDDIRHIDWRVTARTGHPHTKLFREERERPLFIVVDQSRSMFFSSQQFFKSVIAAHLSAIIAWQGFHRRDRVGGIIFNDQELIDLKPIAGKRGTLQFLHMLAKMNQALVPQTKDSVEIIDHDPQQAPLLKALTHLRSVAKPGSLVYLISDFQGLHLEEYGQQQLFEAPLIQLSRHNDIQALFVHDPVEHELPDVGLLSISNGKQRHLIDTHQASLRRKHQQYFNKQKQILTELLLNLGIPLNLFTTAEEADKQFMLERR